MLSRSRFERLSTPQDVDEGERMITLLPSTLADKRILVTGASGFIGSHLCRSLIGAGAEVHGVSRIPHTGVEEGPRWWQGDLSDTQIVRKLISTIKPEIIFHLAAGETRAKRDVNLVLPIFKDNLSTTVNILTAATETWCRRIVLPGSLDEPEPGVPPSSPYAAAHVAMQAYAQLFHRIFQLPVVVARIFMVYGPGQKAVQKLVPYVILALLQGQSPKLSSGQRLVDWIYIDDLVEGLIALAQAPGVEGSAVDLGSGSLVTVRAVVQELVRLAGSTVEPAFDAVQDRAMECGRTAKVNETYLQTGWKPRTSLEKGLSQTIDWYRARLTNEISRATSA